MTITGKAAALLAFCTLGFAGVSIAGALPAAASVGTTPADPFQFGDAQDPRWALEVLQLRVGNLGTPVNTSTAWQALGVAFATYVHTYYPSYNSGILAFMSAATAREHRNALKAAGDLGVAMTGQVSGLNSTLQAGAYNYWYTTMNTTRLLLLASRASSTPSEPR